MHGSSHCTGCCLFRPNWNKKDASSKLWPCFQCIFLGCDSVSAVRRDATMWSSLTLVQTVCHRDGWRFQTTFPFSSCFHIRQWGTCRCTFITPSSAIWQAGSQRIFSQSANASPLLSFSSATLILSVVKSPSRRFWCIWAWCRDNALTSVWGRNEVRGPIWSICETCKPTHGLLMKEYSKSIQPNLKLHRLQKVTTFAAAVALQRWDCAKMLAKRASYVLRVQLV